MRTFLVLLVGILLHPFFSMAFGEEPPLLVRILSLDQASGKISGQVLGVSRKGAGNQEATDIIVQTTSGSLPKGLHPGDIIRVWGEFSGSYRNFLAGNLSSAATRGNKDPTGVRRRLGKGRGMPGTKGGARGHGRK